jgi:putative membrane protein
MPFLTDEDRLRIATAIAAVERRTSGELVAVVAQSAGDYRRVPLLWPALAALLLPAFLLTIEPGMRAWTLYLVQAATFLVLALLAQLPLGAALVPDWIKRRRGNRRAHYVEIIADEGINALVPAGTWDEAVADFVERVRAGRVGEGFLAAVEVVGARLAEHFPRAPDDPDELPNHLIEI